MKENKTQKVTPSILKHKNAFVSKISLLYKHYLLKGLTTFAVAFSLVFAPMNANAGFMSFVSGLFGSYSQASEPTPESNYNLQTMPLLVPSLRHDLKPESEIVAMAIVEDQAMEVYTGPLDIDTDLERYSSDEKIDIYTVKKGDTLDSIAKSMKVSKAAIIYANSDIPRSELTKEGQILTIVPLKGSSYTVKKGDTLESISKKYKISANDLLKFNVLSKASDLKSGSTIILPGLDASSVAKMDKADKAKKEVNVVAKKEALTEDEEEFIDQPESQEPQNPTPSSLDTGSGREYIWPFPAGVGSASQGLHHGNGFDLRAPKGTDIYAVKGGKVLIADGQGYNGGYGFYVVINSPDGSQALYAHMSSVTAVAGQVVNQGDLIGKVGSTGKSTGNHLHFEVRGGFKNPFGPLKVGGTSKDFYNLYK